MVARILTAPVRPSAMLDMLAAGGAPPGFDPAGAGSVARPAPARHALVLCPACGSVLDAPRRLPDSDRVGRKCMVCDEWHPAAAPQRSTAAV